MVIIGINKDTIHKNNLYNSTEYFLYNNLLSTTKAPLISYSIHNLQELNLKINNQNPHELNYYPNEFISEYMVNKHDKKKRGNY